MDARDLEYFVVVAECGNLSHASERLGLSQPGLSKSLRRLEHSVGTKLVKRTARGVELTAVGSVLLTHARRLRLSFDEIEREMSELGQGRAGHLRVGSAPMQIEHLVSPACVTLFNKAPKATIHIAIANNDVLLPALRRGEFDVTICAIPAAPNCDLVQEPLYEDEFVIFCSDRHRLANRKRVTISDLAKERWALATPGSFAPKMLLSMFEGAGFPPPAIVMETEALTPKLHLVSSTDVLGYASLRNVLSFAPRYRLARLHFPDLPCFRTIGVSYRKNAYLPPVTAQFIEILKKTARKITTEK